MWHGLGQAVQCKGMYRGLHGKQGHDLQQVVLDDISNDAILVEVATSALRAEVFAEDDLHIPDEAAAPQGLKDEVGKPQNLQHGRCPVSLLRLLSGMQSPTLLARLGTAQSHLRHLAFAESVL